LFRDFFNGLLVEYFSEPGDTVIDPCSGSFTTGVASFNLGRRFVGCDVDLKCVKNGRQRLAEVVEGRKKGKPFVISGCHQ
jgi:site-specific DNA-methyltransferase (adenine-specific)